MSIVADYERAIRRRRADRAYLAEVAKAARRKALANWHQQDARESAPIMQMTREDFFNPDN